MDQGLTRAGGQFAMIASVDNAHASHVKTLTWHELVRSDDLSATVEAIIGHAAARHAKSADSNEFMEHVRRVMAAHDKMRTFIQRYHARHGAPAAQPDEAAATSTTSSPGSKIPRSVESIIETVLPKTIFSKLLSQDSAASTGDIVAVMEQLPSITLGIRLHNFFLAGFTAETFADTPKQAYQSAMDLLDKAQQLQNRQSPTIASHVRMLSYALAAAEPHSAEVQSWPLKEWAEELANRQLLVAYAQDVASAAGAAIAALERAYADMDTALHELAVQCGPLHQQQQQQQRSSVPRETAFPLFLRLALAWTAACAAADDVAGASAVWESLQRFVGGTAYRSTIEDAQVRYAKTHPLPAQQKKPPTSAPAVACSEDVEVVGPREDDESYAEEPTPLFGGFCPFSAAEPPLLWLLPGHLQHAVRWRGGAVYFSSEAALRAFCADPAATVGRLIETARSNPPMAALLGLAPRALRGHCDATVAAVGQALPPLARACDSSSAGTQADAVVGIPAAGTHPAPLSPAAAAAKLLRLQRCATSTTQTEETHFRRDGQTQVYLPREAGGTQTKRDSAVGVERVPTVTTIPPLLGPGSGSWPRAPIPGHDQRRLLYM